MNVIHKTIIGNALVLALATSLFAQTNIGIRTLSRNLLLQNPVFANNPVALELITNLQTAPAPELTVPEFSTQAQSPAGTYWTLKSPAPLPLNPFPDLPVYAIGTNNDFLIDDRSVDYQALSLLQEVEAQLMGPVGQTLASYTFDTNGLWVQVPANSLHAPGYFIVNVINTVQGRNYDILTKSDLVAPTWTTGLTVTGAVGNVTPVQVPRNNRTNLFVWARVTIASSFYILTQPLSQFVLDGDTVTFAVETSGNTNLTYQWTFKGVAIVGATNNSYTVNNVQDSDAGDYAVTISDGYGSLTSSNATLWTGNDGQRWFSDPQNLINVCSDRQNYTFRSGVTYWLLRPIRLYGETTIEAGAVIKLDWCGGATMQIEGTLTCKGEPYYPAILTSVDDDSVGVQLFDPLAYQNYDWIVPFSVEDGGPYPWETGVAYVDLTDAKSSSISNLRICYADYGVSTPVASRKLDVWDCQFVECIYGVYNGVGDAATNSLHNVLFSACWAAVGATNDLVPVVEAEQMTADVINFCVASAMPSRIALTNSIILGNPVTASNLSTNHVAFNPDPTNFQSVGAGNYYLAANSPLHHAGTANISPRLRTELQRKTTYAPMAIAGSFQTSGQLTLSPQVPRYTNGAPDLGYYYDTLDYTVADMILLYGGNVNVLPGTAIGIRNEPSGARGAISPWGFDLREGSSFVSRGTPNQPIIFSDVQFVQEQWAAHCVAFFVPDFESSDRTEPAPVLDFRFCNFYVTGGWPYYWSHRAGRPFYLYGYLVWAGEDEWQWCAESPDSLVNWSMRDCILHG